jgi:5'-nucleotidase
MKILLSNDDGHQAEGIIALHQALSRIAEVEVIAPEHNNSAKSNALTLNAPLYVSKAHNGFCYINGTPADCVHMALTGLLGYRPDLVVSGINNGANMGDDTIYSGTVGAAMEGYLMGIPAIAFSQVKKGWEHLDAACERAVQLVQQLALRLNQNHAMASGQAAGTEPWLLNVNIPNLPLKDLGELRVTRLGRRHAAQSVTTQLSPRGETMYWIGSAGEAKDCGDGTDFDATARGHISLTPLQIDLTAHAQLHTWRQWANEPAR